MLSKIKQVDTCQELFDNSDTVISLKSNEKCVSRIQIRLVTKISSNAAGV